MSRRAKATETFDRELAGLPEEFRRREYMMRIEAVIFAAAKPVSRDTLAAVIGADCHLDHLIDEIREELRARPYELVHVAGGFRRAFGLADDAEDRPVDFADLEEEYYVAATQD